MEEIKKIKKVLIVGDYSSLGINIKTGLQKNNIEVTLVSNGDGWKKILSKSKDDIEIKNKNMTILKKEIKGTNRLLYIYKYITSIKKKLRVQRYDAVLVMNQKFISTSIIPSYCNGSYIPLNFLKKILNLYGKIFIIAVRHVS